MGWHRILVTFAAAIISLTQTISPTLSLRYPKQYHFVSTETNWTDALTHCRKHYDDLASIHSLEEEGAVQQAVATQGGGRHVKAWTGLRLSGWKWSFQDPAFYSQGGSGFRLWDSNQPDVFRSGPHCALLSGTRRAWVASVCTDRRGSICYNAKLKNPHVLNTDLLSWADALSSCRERHTDLASVRNRFENDRLLGLLGSAPQDVWIGLHGDGWQWSDRSVLSYAHWRERQHSAGEESCVSLDVAADSQWANVACDTLYPFVCYSSGVHRLIVRVNISLQHTNVDLQDPTVHAAILGKIKQRLESLGIPANTNLTWRYGDISQTPQDEP